MERIHGYHAFAPISLQVGAFKGSFNGRIIFVFFSVKNITVWLVVVRMASLLEGKVEQASPLLTAIVYLAKQVLTPCDHCPSFQAAMALLKPVSSQDYNTQNLFWPNVRWTFKLIWHDLTNFHKTSGNANFHETNGQRREESLVRIAHAYMRKWAD